MLQRKPNNREGVPDVDNVGVASERASEVD